MTAGLLVLAWANLIVPLVLAAAAVAVTVVRRIRARRSPPPGIAEPGAHQLDPASAEPEVRPSRRQRA